MALTHGPGRQQDASPGIAHSSTRRAVFTGDRSSSSSQFTKRLAVSPSITPSAISRAFAAGNKQSFSGGIIPLNSHHLLIASARPRNLGCWMNVAFSPRGQRKRAFLEAATDVFERAGSGNERLSLLYGLIACLALGMLAPSSAMAARGTDVSRRTPGESIERLRIALARADVRLPAGGPFPCCPCSGACCSGKPAPPPQPPPAAISAPRAESWAFLAIADASPSLGADWFDSEQDRFRPIHRTFLILRPPPLAR